MTSTREDARARQFEDQATARGVSREQLDAAFNEVFEDVLGWEGEIRDADSPRTIEAWDSLAHVRLLNALETRFDLRLPDEALLEEQHVGSLKALLLAPGDRPVKQAVAIEIAEPKTDEEIDEYYRLRYERLRKPLGLPPGSERDDPAEASSIHFTAKVDGRVIGAGCWVVGSRKDEATGKRYTFVRYRQMVIDPKFEARGIGTRMMRHVEQEARKIGAAEIVANVRMENVEYFKRHDWIEIGEGVTLYDQVDSLSMVKPLRYAIDGGA